MGQIGFKYGLLTAVGLILYFFLMKVLGVVHITELRFLNGIIMAIGVVFAIRSYKALTRGNINYFKGLGTGVVTAITGTLVFAAFMVAYTSVAADEMIGIMSSERYFGERAEATPGIVIFMVLLLEGLISGFMISFIAMQFYKRDDFKAPESR